MAESDSSKPKAVSDAPPAPAKLTGEQILQDLRKRVEAEREKRGALPLDVLERFAAEYRRALDRMRQEVGQALGWTAMPAGLATYFGPHAEVHVQLLARIEQAMRDDLDDLQAEIREVRDATGKSRDRIVLTAQAVLASVLVLITGWYTLLTRQQVDLTDRALRAQLEPSVEIQIPKNTTSLVVSNDGAFPIVDVNVEVEDVVLAVESVYIPTRLTEVSLGTGRPFWHADKLEAKKREVLSLSEDAERALADLTMMEPVVAKGGATDVDAHAPLEAALFVRLTFRREVDGKLYSREARVLAVRVSNTGKPILRPGRLDAVRQTGE